MILKRWLAISMIFMLLLSSFLPPIQALAEEDKEDEVTWIRVHQSTEVTNTEDPNETLGQLLNDSILVAKDIDESNAYIDWMNKTGYINLENFEILDSTEKPYFSKEETDLTEEELILREDIEVNLLDGVEEKSLITLPKGFISPYDRTDEGYLISIGELTGIIDFAYFDEPYDGEHTTNEEIEIETDETEFDNEEVDLDQASEEQTEEKPLEIAEGNEDEATEINEGTELIEDDFAVEAQSTVTEVTASFNSTTRFFEVVSERTPIYDNSTGALIEVGNLYKGQVYPRVRDYGANWHEIKFGNSTGYISKSATRPATGSSLNNINTNYKNSSRMFTASQALPVYDNTSGSLVQFAAIQKDVKYPIVGDYGSWYRVLLSDRVGYVSKSNAIEDFQSSDRFFEVVRNAPIYDNSGGTLVQVGAVTEGQVYPRIRDYGNWHEIKFGDGRGYVSKNATRRADGSSLKNININYRNSDRHFKALRGIPVYDNTSGSLVQFGVINENVTYPIVGDYGSWYRILLSDRVGYVSKSNAEEGFRPNDRFFEAIQDNAPIYDNSSGTLVQVGTITKGQVYPRTRDYGANWHEIQFGSGKGYVSKSATRPATGSSLRNINSNFQNSHGVIKPINNVIVYDNTSGSLVQYGTLQEGIEYPVVNDFGGWYRVLLSDRVGFVNKNNVELIKPIQPPVREVVNPRQNYTYEQMQQDIQALALMYPDLIETRSIGKSVDGRELYAVKLGKGQTEVFFNASNHAREHMTTNVLMKMIDDYARAYVLGNQFDGYNVRTILDQTSIWFVPMVNPDGVTLVQKGHTSAKNPQEVLRLNNNSTDFRAWKANIRGVDLNRQFPANWNTITNNPGRPGPQNYKGPTPLSEPEARALYDFALSRDFKTAISYHSSGEVIYARFDQEPFTRSIAAMVSRKTGYSPIDLQNSSSGGGFTDWFILNQRKPGLTPEISPYVGPRPVPLSNWDRIWSQNNSVGLMIAQEAYQNRNRR
ncbi:M14 family metallocarboxypeptidase [Alkalihalophilus marmarensis]|uniref:M14 family metallocarboxypeptidase n=1 Tax=Alkalihalophilus marmarensis TaxID=521377 RepID=UPI002E1A9AF7|nr:M14 family metallocarboxypeptidase [Alkalihalophilus marmarensis]